MRGTGLFVLRIEPPRAVSALQARSLSPSQQPVGRRGALRLPSRELASPTLCPTGAWYS
jgi:hypothetical protein